MLGITEEEAIAIGNGRKKQWASKFNSRKASPAVFKKKVPSIKKSLSTHTDSSEESSPPPKKIKVETPATRKKSTSRITSDKTINLEPFPSHDKNIDNRSQIEERIEKVLRKSHSKFSESNPKLQPLKMRSSIKHLNLSQIDTKKIDVDSLRKSSKRINKNCKF